ncbi:hypothetical protein [Hutsoniella sourekii]|uniref:hypothetical protein n=1 Tax=Hutsoniella sourekii TaxID=87650 RepID=UPI0004872215|nr:hypothetical protein [Hutsoniella sourekii]
MCTISIKITDKEFQLIREMADYYDKTPTEYIKDVVLDQSNKDFVVRFSKEQIQEYQSSLASLVSPSR